MKRVHVKTLGCKVNSYDSDDLETQFLKKGFTIESDPKKADVSVLNTCSVTANADKEARYYLRRFRRDNPEALVVATGCYAQTDSARLADMNDVDLVFPNEVKDRVVEVAHEQLINKQQGEPLTVSKIPKDVKPVAENRQGHFKSSLKLNPTDSSKTRAFLKIQDGCNGFCSYCLIPYARGASRSVPSRDVIAEVRRLIESGVKEIVFTGIHIGDYGEDLDESQSFIDIIKELFDWDDMVRMRISSLEPRELPESLLKVVSQRPELFCDHFHLPLQAGHNRVLKMMRRTYTTEQYQEAVELARSYFPHANFGADVIPGFPGETEEEFAATVDFIKTIGLNYLHVFPYSKRPNTAAARMPDHLPHDTVKQRSALLRGLSSELKSEYVSRFLGETVSVLWEADKDRDGRRIGRSRNYLEIVTPEAMNQEPGTLSQVKIKGFVNDNRLLGLIKG
ncbi:MAG: tRNA (N(6)-L-threonylcarbamoyladenosine(37)-C(2))-methylthiotransferase MtaB [Pseudobacteriovorax sp.]|nr:tRNA (N(6)-L-threonylcarbamoyladenosine(37)-C(2))-methylthiotransferase MtaB [Pseudobacteriovorax sp.]